MKTKIFASLAVVVVGGLITVSTYGCDQPPPKCAAGRGAFTTRYTVVSGPPSCADTKGEVLGFSTYNPPGPHDGKPNLDIASIAVQAEPLGVAADTAAEAGSVDPDPTHKQYSLGFFTTASPVNDFCEVPSLTVATQNIPAVKADPDKKVEASPATSITYQFANVRLYVTPGALGTQLTADLTKTVDDDICVYRVTGMYPVVSCGIEDPNDPDKQVPDDLDGVAKSCAPESDEDAGRPTGSGINPDFPVRCDPDTLTCFITKDVPALK